MQTTESTSALPSIHRPNPTKIRRAVARRSFATLATNSDSGRSHVAGILYEIVDGAMYISTLKSSRKARNVESNRHVALVIPIRRLPVGPPSTVQFQAEATILDTDDAEIRRLVTAGQLKSITAHDELELADGCFLRIPMPERLVTYGLGMSIRRLVTDPLSAGGVVSQFSEKSV